MKTLVLVRHGQSKWNLENRFTGWKDVDLSDQGVDEAKAAGKLLRERGFEFDVAFTSFLIRAIKTLHYILEEMGTLWLPVYKSWRLNERHYGALQGLDKTETAAKHGAEQVKIWRRSYSVRPPQLELDDARYLEVQDRRYADTRVPQGESLADTVERVLPYWESNIVPELKNNRRVLVVAHGNSLRGLVKHLEQMSDDEIVQYELATGKPLVYELDDNLKVVNKK